VSQFDDHYAIGNPPFAVPILYAIHVASDRVEQALLAIGLNGLPGAEISFATSVVAPQIDQLVGYLMLANPGLSNELQDAGGDVFTDKGRSSVVVCRVGMVSAT